jgi:uncharacterized protein YjbJ (UPF0337 family)
LRNLTLGNGGERFAVKNERRSPEHATDHSTPKSQNFMATLEVKGDRNIIKGKLKQMRAKLTDDKLQYVEGKSEELLGRVQKQTDGIREAVKKSAAGRCE